MNANLRAIGFCGVDNSVSPEILQVLSNEYPFIEWGVLFRTDLEGQPRYPTWDWVLKLSSLKLNTNSQSNINMKLAGHLCGNRCQEVLSGDSTFIKQLYELGFRRVQINATAANSVLVDLNYITTYLDNIKKCMKDVEGMEFIIQCNDETKVIYEKLILSPEKNMSILYDASCGKGIRVSNFPSPSLYPSIPCGYAGGIGVDCIADILTTIATITNPTLHSNQIIESKVWIDMESSLRTMIIKSSKMVDTTNNTNISLSIDQVEDVFSIEKCMKCILIGLQFGLVSYSL